MSVVIRVKLSGGMWVFITQPEEDLMSMGRS